MSNYDDGDQGYDGQHEDEAPRQQKPSAALVTKQDAMGNIELARRTELAVASAQARVTAMVQAKYVMALQRPRDPAAVEQALFARCAQKDFAEVAIYRRPQGKKKDENGNWVPNIIEGLSIRFVEEAVRCNRNMGEETVVLYDDEEKQVIRCSVMDYESVTDASAEVTVFKTQERSKLGRGQVPLGRRTNSYGDDVFIVPASDDEARLKTNRIVSMTLRTLGLRMLPGGMVAEAKRRIYDTLKNQDKGKDPLAVRRDIADKFAAMGISAQSLSDYFGGVSVQQITNDQVLEARIIGATLTTGEASWRDILEGSPYRSADAETEDGGKKNEAAAKVADKVKAALEKKRAGGVAKSADGAPAAAAATPPVATGKPTAAISPELSRLIVGFARKSENATDEDIAKMAIAAGHTGVTAAMVTDILASSNVR